MQRNMIQLLVFQLRAAVMSRKARVNDAKHPLTKSRAVSDASDSSDEAESVSVTR